MPKSTKKETLVIEPLRIKPLRIKPLRIKPLKIPSPSKFILGEIKEEKRIPISSDTKKVVYDRAKGRCESCGRFLRMNVGEFHHIRRPTVRSSSSSIQFLCRSCHRKWGHERKVKIGPYRKKTYIQRKKVQRHSSPHWKKSTRKNRK